jgi:C-3',4' desaturase CrtD
MVQLNKTHRIGVIGAGIGGLTTAALLAQQGHHVTVLEANPYPGGSAATFFHKGYRFDAGATVVGGFQDNGPHAQVGKKLDMTWTTHPSDLAWTVHLPDRCIPVARDKRAILQEFPHSAPFWKEQEQLADVGWSFAAQGLPFPPQSLAEWKQIIRLSLKNIPAGLRVLPYVFRSTHDWLSRHGLDKDRAFVRFIDGQLLISAQTTSRFANAMYSATALDLARQGVVHVRGGIGQLAESLADKVIEHSGEVLYRHQVTGLQIENERVTGVNYQVGRRNTQVETLPCDFVVANLTPLTLSKLRGKVQSGDFPQDDGGWGAFVLHVGVDNDKLPRGIGDHHQIITDWVSPLGEGHSIFVSISPQWDETRAPTGKRAVTITTHTAIQAWWDLHERDLTAYTERKDDYTDRLLTAVDNHLHGLRNSVSLVLPGTPVTYQYYTGRAGGLVGGFPQTSLFKARGPRTDIPNLHLVGDSIFPGQSTAGVTVGAMRVADAVQHILN